MTKRHLDIQGSIVRIEFSAGEHATELTFADNDVHRFVMELALLRYDLASQIACVDKDRHKLTFVMTRDTRSSIDAERSLVFSGWSVKIDLHGTPLESGRLEPVSIERSEEDWIHCVVEQDVFHGCGARATSPRFCRPSRNGRSLSWATEWCRAP